VNFRKFVVCHEKFWYVRKIFGPLKWYTDRNFFGDGGGGGLSSKIILSGKIFLIADYSKIVRIHLVNEYGNRVISGNGELFVNSTARHREELIKTLDSSQCQTGLIFTRLLFLR
jgi:hypothetical protein